MGRDVFHSGLHENISIPSMISPGTICKVSIISSKQRGTECLHDKNCPAFAGIPVERTGIPLRRDGTKDIPANIFSIKKEGNKYERYKHGEIPFNFPSRLPYI